MHTRRQQESCRSETPGRAATTEKRKTQQNRTVKSAARLSYCISADELMRTTVAAAAAAVAETSFRHWRL